MAPPRYHLVLPAPIQSSVLLILPLLSINSVFRFLSSIDLFLYVHQMKFLVGRKTLKITKQILEI